MEKVVLYDSGATASTPSQYAPSNTIINLEDNLSNYDFICIQVTTTNDYNTGWWNVFYDVELCLEFIATFHIWMARAMWIEFTDTTFKIAFQSYEGEGSSCCPQLYKIYGYKF